MPPYGYRLEHAVGTTYSLDLETLTGVSIALGLSEDTDSELARNPISLLSALQKVSDQPSECTAKGIRQDCRVL